MTFAYGKLIVSSLSLRSCLGRLVGRTDGWRGGGEREGSEPAS